jgi:hypothetical protein
MAMAANTGTKGRLSESSKRQAPDLRASRRAAPAVTPPIWGWVGLVVAGTLLVIAMLISVPALTSSLQVSRTVTKLKYEQTLSFDYLINVKPSTLYPDGRVTPPPSTAKDEDATAPRVSVPSVLVNTIDLSFNYGLSSASASDLHGTILADMEIESLGDTAWTKRLPFVPPTPFEGANATGSGVLDLVAIDQTIRQIESETGSRPGQYKLSIVPVVQVEGSAGGDEFNATYQDAFSFDYERNQISPQNELTSSKPNQATDTVRSAKHIGLILASPSVSEARIIGVLLFGIAAIGCAGFTGVVFLGLGQNEVAKAFARHQLKLVHVSDVEDSGVQRIRLREPGDLAKVAKRDGNIVFVRDTETHHVFFVPSGAVTYEYLLEPRA